jgi:hypothetical protein
VCRTADDGKFDSGTLADSWIHDGWPGVAD